MSEANKIYIVAGERVIAAASVLGGLYANVGQTARKISERLQDDDYRKKAAGGKWVVLFEESVGSSLTDYQIHEYLKKSPEVRWDRNSSNTEEFFFSGDPGDGSVAKRVVNDILKKIFLPRILEENKRLQSEIIGLQRQVGTLSEDEMFKTIQDLSSILNKKEEYQKNLLKNHAEILQKKDARIREITLLSEENSRTFLEKERNTKNSFEYEESKLKRQISILQQERDESSFVRIFPLSIFISALVFSAILGFWVGINTPQSPKSNEIPTCTPVSAEASLPLTTPEFTPKAKAEDTIAERMIADREVLRDAEVTGAKFAKTEERKGDRALAFPLTPEQEAKLRQTLNLKPDQRLEPYIRILGEEGVKSALGESTAQQKPPKPVPQDPSYIKADLFIKFENCIYRQADSRYDEISDIMKCNNGNELEMKKCLMEEALVGWVSLAHASDCWKRNH